jgi:hypothetical protein
MKAFVESTGGAPVQVKSHPIRFGSGDWTCVVGELEDGSRMVTVAKWRDGATARNGQILWIAGPPDHAAPSVWLVGLITSLLGCASAGMAEACATRAAV